MAQIVINISDEEYESYKKLKEYGFGTMFSGLVERIANGIVLPKGHGDLKDMEDIYEALEGWDDDTGWIVDAIDCEAPTIIKADEEGEE